MTGSPQAGDQLRVNAVAKGSVVKENNNTLLILHQATLSEVRKPMNVEKPKNKHTTRCLLVCSFIFLLLLPTSDAFTDLSPS